MEIEKKPDILATLVEPVTPGFLEYYYSSLESKSQKSQHEGGKIRTRDQPLCDDEGRLKLLNKQVEDSKWTNKTKERHLIRERGGLLKEGRELHHSTNVFNRSKAHEAKEHFNELQDKIKLLSKLHHSSYQTNKRNTSNRIENKTKNLKRVSEEGRKLEMALTTTELRYKSILSAMDQAVAESEQLAMQFEKQLRDKARQHHELGLQLTEVGAQLRLEKDKRAKFLRDEERRRKVEALEKLTEWKESESMNQQLKSRLKKFEDKFYEEEQKLGKSKRDVEYKASLTQREIGRKLQDVNCLLRNVSRDQRQLSNTKLHIDNQSIIAKNEARVQDHLGRHQSSIAHRQAKINRWEPKLKALAQENENRLEVMERNMLYEELGKAGDIERDLYRKMRQLESDTRKQEQVCSHKQIVLDKMSTKARKDAQDHLRQIDAEQNDLEGAVKREEGALKELVVLRDNALTEYRQHQSRLKQMIQLFHTLSCEQERKIDIKSQQDVF